MALRRAPEPSPVGDRDGVSSPGGFGDRLAERVLGRQSQLVLGLDPDPVRLWPAAVEAAAGAGTVAPRGAAEAGSAAKAAAAAVAARAAAAVSAHCALAIEAAGEHCVAVKLQVACFERLGAPGWSALSEVSRCAREHGLLVIADAKRGDIEVTAAAYGQAFLGDTPTVFGPVAGLGADALTANPLLGVDSLRPLAEAARGHGAGLFVLVRTSNPGAGDVQELALSGGGTVSERLAAIVAELGETGRGRAGITDIGAVVGATAPQRLEALRRIMPHAAFLLPGIGAQGGQVDALAAAFLPGPAGGLIAASRGIVDAHERTGGDPGDAARREAARLRELAWTLAEAS